MGDRARGQDLIVYVDTSAVVKRVLIENESSALVDYLDAAVADHGAALVSATVTEVEVARRFHREGTADDVPGAVANTLAGVSLIPIDRRIERAAMSIPDQYLRSFDALHVASAQRVNATEFVTYDKRQADAARAAGFSVVVPGGKIDASAD
ncbi:type II toxin-antitoxin system VapC family toxin [Georgenia sp. TF02-10]|uniref:type II toxin-antitoxin system VapC family toxin n=1 Tax=Georgenia sp. TF02-10 TaxID=2917725 RepID=UPI001FA6C45D|nr:type II toxin-antitoxin system VapC family toxin [Georgenia sp. TF02-10]UNX55823.1 type II toxin-antitoxin system VapC family toxin [Georgenia sp. TF02-10]